MSEKMRRENIFSEVLNVTRHHARIRGDEILTGNRTFAADILVSELQEVHGSLSVLDSR